MAFTWITEEQFNRIQEAFPTGTRVMVSEKPTNVADVETLGVSWIPQKMDGILGKPFIVHSYGIKAHRTVDGLNEFGIVIQGGNDDFGLEVGPGWAMRLEWLDDPRLTEILDPTSREANVQKVAKEYQNGWHLIPGEARKHPSLNCGHFMVYIEDGEPCGIESYENYSDLVQMVQEFNKNVQEPEGNHVAFMDACEREWGVSILQILADDIVDSPEVPTPDSISGAGWAALGVGLFGLAAAKKKLFKAAPVDAPLQIEPLQEEKRAVVVETVAAMKA